MIPTAALEKAFSLLSLATSRPVEFRERLGGIAENALESVPGRRPDYRAAAWSVVLPELDREWPEFSSYLKEPLLREHEARVEARYNEVADGAWARRYNADLTLARCLYALCRAMKPELVVETGVAYGMSSAFLLEALDRNGTGALLSIDLPPLGGRAQELVGALVPLSSRGRWTLRRGTSRRELPAAVRQRQVDLFVHDSLHTLRNMRREFEDVWPWLRSGGVLVSDDIEGNSAFLELRARRPRFWRAIQEEGKASLIGIAVKGTDLGA